MTANLPRCSGLDGNLPQQVRDGRQPFGAWGCRVWGVCGPCVVIKKLLEAEVGKSENSK